MASEITHPVVPVALAIALGSNRVPPSLTAVACLASVLPDVDSLGLWAGIPYDHPLGHRGFTHSLFFALTIAIAATALSRRLGTPAVTTFAVVFASTASHGLLDAMTTGGLGVAFFSPFSNARYFLPWRVLLVSPIGIRPFLSARGLAVLRSEIAWVWFPAALFAGSCLLLRRFVRIG